MKIYERLFAGALLVGLLAWTGCGPAGGLREIKVEGKQSTALEDAKSLVQNYANGAPMTSEVDSFPDLIEEVKKTDPQKGDILEKGLKDLQKSPSGRAAKAKALLRKL